MINSIRNKTGVSYSLKMLRLASRCASCQLVANNYFIEVIAPHSLISDRKLNCSFEPLDGVTSDCLLVLSTNAYLYFIILKNCKQALDNCPRDPLARLSFLWLQSFFSNSM